MVSNKCKVNFNNRSFFKGLANKCKVNFNNRSFFKGLAAGSYLCGLQNKQTKQQSQMAHSYYVSLISRAGFASVGHTVTAEGCIYITVLESSETGNKTVFTVFFENISEDCDVVRISVLKPLGNMSFVYLLV